MNITETLMHDYRDINKTLQLTNSLTHTYLAVETLFVKDASHSAGINILPRYSSICRQTLERKLHANCSEIAISVVHSAAGDSDVFARVLKLEAAVGGTLTKRN